MSQTPTLSTETSDPETQLRILFLCARHARAHTHAHDWLGRVPDRTVTDTENETENAAEARKNVGMQPSLPLNLLGRPKKSVVGWIFDRAKWLQCFFGGKASTLLSNFFSTRPIRLNLFLHTSILPRYPTDGVARIFSLKLQCCNRESNSHKLSSGSFQGP